MLWKLYKNGLIRTIGSDEVHSWNVPKAAKENMAVKHVLLKHDGMNGSYIVADVVTSLDES